MTNTISPLHDWLDQETCDGALYVQAANGNDWENAHKISEEHLPLDISIRNNLVKSETDIAIEVFFRTLSGRKIYFGARTHATDHDVRDRFLTNFIDSAFDAQRFLEAASRIVGVPKDRLFQHPESLDIGVADWWESFGHEQIWTSASPNGINLGGLEDARANNDAIAVNSHNYQVLVMTYGGQPSYWIGVDVSHSTTSPFELDRHRAHAAAERFMPP